MILILHDLPQFKNLKSTSMNLKIILKNQIKMIVIKAFKIRKTKTKVEKEIIIDNK